MTNIFEVLDYKFFQVFVGENRRMHAETIMVISDFFNRQNASFVNKELLIDHVTEYMRNRRFNYSNEQDSSEKDFKDFREKAISEINLFKRNGWLLEEVVENYKSTIIFEEGVPELIKTLNDICNNTAPKEYTGYIYVIDGLLRDFDFSKGISYLERIYDDTNTLMNRLRGLNSCIKRYYTKLLKENNDDANRIINILLGDYQETIVSKAFTNLKTKDNPSKYKRGILKRLNELKEDDNLQELVKNYRDVKKTDLSDEKIEKLLLEMIDYVYENFEYLQNTIAMIDIKNNKYVKSSTAKIKLIIQKRKDVVGKVEEVLKRMIDIDGEIYSDAFSLYRTNHIDKDSLYKPRVIKRNKKDRFKLEKIEVNEEYVNEVKRNLFKEDKFSKKIINRYVMSKMGSKKMISVKELDLNTSDDLSRIILIRLYSDSDKVGYITKSTGEKYDDGKFIFDEFVIIERELICLTRI